MAETLAPDLRPSVDVRRAGGRFETALPWLDSRHSFSFGPHRDPRNTHFGVLLVNNDDRVAPDTGFDTHPHRDMEIVTWVLDGELEHRDSMGHSGIIYPGLAQRMSAGTGILHSEMNRGIADAPGARTGTSMRPRGPVHFVQMWVVPDEGGIEPGYEQLDVNAELARGGLQPVASGMGDDAAIRIAQRHARLLAARLAPGEVVELPDAPFVHLFVPKGDVELEGAGGLDTGDAVRLTGAGGPRLTAGADGAEVLVWEMHAALR
ncbi:MAG: pirin family protein [Actinomycetes bacterium]